MLARNAVWLPSRPCLSRAYGFAMLLGLLQLHAVSAMVVKGDMHLSDFSKKTNFFLSKFCFDFDKSHKGVVGTVKFTAHATAPVDDSVFYLLAFDDEEHSWPKIRENFDKESCHEIINMGRGNQQPVKYYTSVDVSTGKGDRLFNITQAKRARFWYFVLIRCPKDSKTLKPAASPDGTLTYSLHTMNVRRGALNEEFSFDKMYIMHLYFVFLVLFAVPTWLLGQDYLRSLYNERHKSLQDNPYLRPMLAAFGSSAVSCFLFLVFYIAYAWDGISWKVLFVAATFWEVASNSFIYIMVSLASMGYGLSSVQKLSGMRCILLIIAGVGIISAWMELETFLTQDPSAHLYAYQSFSGFVALALKVVMFVLFMCQLRLSHHAELSERLQRFYKLLGVCFSIWFLNVPVMVLLAYLLAHEWRFWVVTVIELVVRFLGQISFAIFFCGPLSPFYVIGKAFDVPTNVASLTTESPNPIGMSLRETEMY